MNRKGKSTNIFVLIFMLTIFINDSFVKSIQSNNETIPSVVKKVEYSARENLYYIEESDKHLALDDNEALDLKKIHEVSASRNPQIRANATSEEDEDKKNSSLIPFIIIEVIMIVVLTIMIVKLHRQLRAMRKASVQHSILPLQLLFFAGLATDLIVVIVLGFVIFVEIIYLIILHFISKVYNVKQVVDEVNRGKDEWLKKNKP